MNSPDYNTNDHGFIVNAEGTYRRAAADLCRRHAISLNWTDDEGTLYNVLLAADVRRYGTIGGMVDNSPGKLWVGVVGKGCFGFSSAGSYLSADYVAEKLNLPTATAVKMAELLTGVRAHLFGGVL